MTTKKWKRTVSRINIGFDETSKNSSYNLLGIGQTPGKESFGNQSFLYNAVFYFGGPKNEEHLCQREPLRPQDGSFFMTKTCKRSNFLFVSLYKICEISFSDRGIYLRASKISKYISPHFFMVSLFRASISELSFENIDIWFDFFKRE